MFSSVLGETNLPAIEPWVITFGQESLELFYKYIWAKCRQPEIENFGKRFFLELCDTPFQILLVKKYLGVLNSMYSDLFSTHQSMLSYCISDDLEDEK
jgi:hypothetical protein